MTQEAVTRLERERYAAWGHYDRTQSDDLYRDALMADDRYLNAVWRMVEMSPEWAGYGENRRPDEEMKT